MDDSKKIIRNLSFIKKTICDVDSVIDILIEEEILGMNERNIILSEVDPVHSVLEIVIKKQAFHRFVKALQSTGNDRIISRLESTKHTQETEGIQTTKCDEVKGADGETKQETSMIQSQLENLKIENQSLKEQQAQIRKILNEKQKKLLDLKRESCNYEKQNEELTNRLSILRRSDVIQSKIDGQELQLNGKIERNKELNNELWRKTDEVETLKRTLEKLKLDVDEKSDQIAMLSKEMELLKDEHLTARSERKEMKNKIDNISSNLEEKMQNMISVLTNGGNKTFRTTRQCTFVRTPRTRAQSQDRGQNKDSASLPSLGHKTPRNGDTKPKDSSCKSQGIRNSRSRQQFLSPQSVFSTKSEKLTVFTRPTAQWK